MVDMDARQFSESLLEMAEYVDGKVIDVIRKTLIDLYRRLVERTPIDIGRAKASWGITTFSEDHEIPDDPDGYSVNEISEIIETQIDEFKVEVIDDQVIIYNNLEYIELLEGGSSKQAPEGMVAISITEFEALFNRAIRQLAGDIT